MSNTTTNITMTCHNGDNNRAGGNAVLTAQRPQTMVHRRLGVSFFFLSLHYLIYFFRIRFQILITIDFFVGPKRITASRNKRSPNDDINRRLGLGIIFSLSTNVYLSGLNIKLSLSTTHSRNLRTVAPTFSTPQRRCQRAKEGVVNGDESRDSGTHITPGVCGDVVAVCNDSHRPSIGGGFNYIIIICFGEAEGYTALAKLEP